MKSPRVKGYRVTLSADERWLLLTYRSAPVMARAIAVTGLVEAIVRPLPHERPLVERALPNARRSLGFVDEVSTARRWMAWAGRQRAFVLGLRVGRKTVGGLLRSASRKTGTA